MAATNDYLTTRHYLVNTFTTSGSRDLSSEEECFDDNCVKCRDGLHGYKTKADAARLGATAVRYKYPLWPTVAVDYGQVPWDGPQELAINYKEPDPPKLDYKVEFRADGSWDIVWDNGNIAKIGPIKP